MVHHRKFVALLLLASTGCTSVYTQSGSPADIIAQNKASDRVQLTVRSGLKVDMRSPTIVGDSIIGYSHRPGDIRRVRQAEAMNDVTSIAIKKTNQGETLLLAMGIIAGFVVVAGASAMSGWSSSGGY